MTKFKNEKTEDQLAPWTKMARQHKMSWVENTSRGDMTPTVLALKDGNPLLMVVARNVDKMEGLKIARMLREGFGADELIIFLDAHMTVPTIPSEKRKELLKKYSQPGSMQKACDEQGACAQGEITDVLLCHSINCDGKMSAVCMPYDYHGKDGGVAFHWKDDLISSMGDSEDQKIDGMIPNALRQIMKQPMILDNPDIPGILGIGDYKLSREQKEFHIQRAARRVMLGQGFIILEVINVNMGDTEKEIEGKLSEQYEKIHKIYDGIKPYKDELSPSQ